MLSVDERTMGIYANGTDFEFYEDRVPTLCFYCFDPLDLTGNAVQVYWHGCDSNQGGLDIAFHPECAGRLAIHLASDSLKAKNPLLRSKIEVEAIERQIFNKTMKGIEGFEQRPGEYR
jgi:hypothetical protein